MFETLKLERIPKISDERLYYLNEKIVPLCLFNFKQEKDDIDARLYLIEPVDLKKVSFVWNPKPIKIAVGYYWPAYGSIITYHSFGAPSLFKPSIEEVLTQINQLSEDQLNMIRGYCVDDTDLDCYNVLSDGYHFTKTRLFQKYIVTPSGNIIGYETHKGPVYYEDLRREKERNNREKVKST